MLRGIELGSVLGAALISKAVFDRCGFVKN